MRRNKYMKLLDYFELDMLRNCCMINVLSVARPAVTHGANNFMWRCGHFILALSLDGMVILTRRRSEISLLGPIKSD